MIPYVVGRDGASIEDLRERFGYTSDAEVVKDLQLIFLTGLPGYGPGDLIDVDIFDDEVSIDSADYFGRPMRLTPSEALGLLAAGSTFIASDQATPELRSAIDKLSHAIGAEVDDRVLVVVALDLVHQERNIDHVELVGQDMVLEQAGERHDEVKGQ